MSGIAGTNGNGRAMYAAQESPFATESLYSNETGAAPLSPAAAFATQAESPFVTEYGSGATAESMRAEEYASLLGELYSSEFETAVSDLVHEATAVAEQHFAWEGEDPVHQRAVAERALREYFAPLERESHAFIDRLSSAAATANLPAMGESELQEFLDRFQSPATTMSPSMEQFLGKFISKAKKAVSGAVKLVKKGVAFVNKFSPLHIVLNKLKALVRPLLERVLKFALDKLPAALRPAAATLANKLFGVKVKEPAADASPGEPAPDAAGEDEVAGEAPYGHEHEEELQELEPAAADTREIQEELDAELAGSVFAGESFEQALAVEKMTAADPVREQAMHRLSHARKRFADRILAMRAGDDPQPALEEFIPAILAAVKLGISIIGRPKVVKFLGGLVAPLIAPYVGKEPAAALSSALADTGLKLMTLELTSEDETRAAANAVVATVEGTVNRLVNAVPEAEWENDNVLHGYVRSAFEQEAAASFPDSHIRPKLHETDSLPGQWTDMPLKATRKSYRKYSRVAEVTLSPQKAEELKTFGGTTVAAYLRDRLGLPANQTVRAKVHLYEAKRGTRVGMIAAGESNVPGLGHSRREARSLFHPLTRAAAGLLLGEPKLGVDVGPRLLEDRDRIGVGQRLYYLEIAGAHARVPASGRGTVNRETGQAADHHPAHPTQGTFVIDVPKRELRVALFYAEQDAQALAVALRKHAPAATILASLRTLLQAQIRAALARPGRGARLIHEAVQTERSPAAAMSRIFRMLGKPIGKLLGSWMLHAVGKELEDRYDQFADTFAKAADAVDDGVTVLVTVSAPGIIDPIRKILKKGFSIAAIPALLKAPKPSSFIVEIKPGYVRL